MIHRRKGFTLIELLIVVVIIGVLAAIAVPKFQSTKGKANAAALRSDLRNLATAQEAYMFETVLYSTDQAELKYQPSRGVTVTIGTASASGWSAQATHPSSFPFTCALYFGTVASPPSIALTEGAVYCQ